MYSTKRECQVIEPGLHFLVIVLNEQITKFEEHIRSNVLNIKFLIFTDYK